MNKALLLLLVLMLSLPLMAEEKMTIGRYKSRAILNIKTCNAPLIILIPGSGAHGPEEMMPASATGNGLDHSLFGSFTKGLNAGGASTLALGKPGVDFFKSWNRSEFFYDLPMYKNLGWQDLINNLKDAVDFAKKLPCVNPERIYVLGHSEGTQVASDYAKEYPEALHGIVLVGFSGESLSTTVDWQLFRRSIDLFISADIDKNHDNFISKEEAVLFSDTFHWDFRPSEDKVSIDEIEAYMRSIKAIQDQFNAFAGSKIWEGVFNRPPLYNDIAALPINIYTFTGAFDVQTRPEEALRLKEACTKVKKMNCEVTIVEGLGHAMSKPQGPRGHRLLDSTLGPVDESFISILNDLALRL